MNYRKNVFQIVHMRIGREFAILRAWFASPDSRCKHVRNATLPNRHLVTDNGDGSTTSYGPTYTREIDMYHNLLNFFLPLLLRYTSSRYPMIAKRSAERQFWDIDRIEVFQLERINELLAYATKNVPYYKEVINKADAQLSDLSDVSRLPILTKDDVSAHFPDGITSTAIDKDEIRWAGTGGTTQHILVASDFNKRDHVRAASQVTFSEDSPYRFGRRAAFIPPDACSALCATDGLRETTVFHHVLKMIRSGKLRDASQLSDLRGLVMNNWIECKSILEPFGPEGTHIDADRMAEYANQLRNLRPYLFKALPEYLLTLARYYDSTGQKPPEIPVIKPMGALMTPAMKRRVSQVFGQPITEDYGCNDLGPLGFECSHGGLHLLSDHFYFEFQTPKGPAEDGELATLIVTDLHNRAMPMIRYRLGDLVTVDRSPCACGRTTPRVSVEGRACETIVRDDGTVLTPRQVCEALYSLPWVQAFQLVEKSAWNLELKVVTDHGYEISDDDVRRLQSSLGNDRELVIRKVNSIRPEASGKFLNVKSRSSHKLGRVLAATHRHGR